MHLRFFCTIVFLLFARASVSSVSTSYSNWVTRTIDLKPFVHNPFSIAFGLSQDENLTTTDKQRILDVQNLLRLRLALGNEKKSWDGAKGYMPMPPAANMQAVEWDDDLADYAQNWASQCGQGHSNLQNLNIERYKSGNVGENICGGITFLEKDMYGEVKWWNYKKFGCKKGKQCGHYKTFASWGMNHVGCGWKVCSSFDHPPVPRMTLVCVHGGYMSSATEEGKKRLPWQREYLKGPPCSSCEQGWDYCMGGGLCATKKQCDSDPSNQCTCNHDAVSCFNNGGIFDPDGCTCKCPSGRMGINCAKKCRNENPGLCGMKCVTDDMADIYFCKKGCAGCGKKHSPAYKFYFMDRKTKNKYNIKVRHFMENPDMEAKFADFTTKKVHGKCKNKASDESCEILYLRNYCHDKMLGSAVKPYCGLSCEECPKKDPEQTKRTKEVKKAAAAASNAIDLSNFSLKGFKIVSSKVNSDTASSSGSPTSDAAAIAEAFASAGVKLNSATSFGVGEKAGSISSAVSITGTQASTSSTDKKKTDSQLVSSTSANVNLNTDKHSDKLKSSSTGTKIDTTVDKSPNTSTDTLSASGPRTSSVGGSKTIPTPATETKGTVKSSNVGTSSAQGFVMGDGSKMSSELKNLLGNIDLSKLFGR